MNWKAALLEVSPVQHDQWNSWPDVASLHDRGEHFTLLQPRRLQVKVCKILVLVLSGPSHPPPDSLVASPQILGAGLRARRGDAGHPPIPIRGAQDDVCQWGRLHAQWRLLSLSPVRSAQRQQLPLWWVRCAAFRLGSGSMPSRSLELYVEINV